MDSIGNWITPELTSSLVSSFGLPADTVNSALQTSSATILTTLASKAQNSHFLTSIHQIVTGAHAASPTEAATHFLTILFGSHLAAVESAVAEADGIPADAAGAVLASASSLVLQAISDSINASGATLASLESTLTAELPGLKGYLPQSFVIPGLAAPEPSANRVYLVAAENTPSAAGWHWPVLLLGALLITALVWYFSQGKETTARVTEAPDQTATAPATPAPDAPPKAAEPLGAFFKRKLPSGVELNIPRNGIENKLVSFMEDASSPVDKETWFDFDRLLFATGSSQLEPSSNEQLKNVADILKSYPKVHLRIGGYTDNTGNAKANRKLSQERASTVMSQLVSMGVQRARLDARGYGEEHPVADNSTEAGRSKNRRISVRVTQK